LVAIDTGIERGVDAQQLQWITAALDRAQGAFTMAILGHPFYSSGREHAGNEALAW
jgi:hypothetical protein